MENQNDKGIDGAAAVQQTGGKLLVRDVVFLAVISAVTLLTCSIMPLVAGVPLFGLPHLVTGLQLGLFYAIGIMKVRKTGALLLMALFTGVIQLMMAPVMFLSNIFCGIIIEAVIYFTSRGFKSTLSVFLAAALFNPLSLPFNYFYNLAVGKGNLAEVVSSQPWIAVLMSLAVVTVTAAGALAGIKIAGELKKSGALKR